MVKKKDWVVGSLTVPTDLSDDARDQVAAGLTRLLADIFALFVKTKNFHWHISGPHFRDYHLLLDEQAGFVFAMIDQIAERARKLGGTTLRSIGHVAKLQRIADNDEIFVGPASMLYELREDNLRLVHFMREIHKLCEERGDVATASLVENWIDQTEQRIWFLFEATRTS